MMPSAESIPVEPPPDKYSQDVLSGKSLGGGQCGNLFPTAGRMRISRESSPIFSSPRESKMTSAF